MLGWRYPKIVWQKTHPWFIHRQTRVVWWTCNLTFQKRKESQKPSDVICRAAFLERKTPSLKVSNKTNDYVRLRLFETFFLLNKKKLTPSLGCANWMWIGIAIHEVLEWWKTSGHSQDLEFISQAIRFCCQFKEIFKSGSINQSRNLDQSTNDGLYIYTHIYIYVYIYIYGTPPPRSTCFVFLLVFTWFYSNFAYSSKSLLFEEGFVWNQTLLFQKKRIPYMYQCSCFHTEKKQYSS